MPSILLSLLVLLALAGVIAASRRLIGTSQRKRREMSLLVLAAVAVGLALAVSARLHPVLAYNAAVGLVILGTGLHVLYEALRRSTGRVRMWSIGSGLVMAVLLIAGFTVAKLLVKNSMATGQSVGGYVPSNRAVFNCPHPSDCPGPSYPVFNSYVNTANYGDERAFFDVRPLEEKRDKPGLWKWSDVLQVSPGDELVMRVYYDNNGDARAEIDAGESTARQVRVSVLLPYNRDRQLTPVASITSVNTKPKFVGDGVTLRSDTAINILFVPGTARLTNRAYPHGLLLDNDLFSGRGVPIGYKKMDGRVAGCFCQAGFVTFRVRVI
jgi:hypothetical protein